MFRFQQSRQRRLPTKIISLFTSLIFATSLILPPSIHAQTYLAVPQLPSPGSMVTPSVGYTPAIIQGITINVDNPLAFDFIVDNGDSALNGAQFEEESIKLIKYFLATLTLPEDEVWVNLSPYEGDRIIPDALGTTEMGRDLLTQDYMLKQLTASLMYPEEELGQKFWSRVYRRAQQMFGTTEIPISTFNKVWIVPDKAVILEDGNTAYIAESHLKVMLEEDYLSLMENISNEDRGTDLLAEDQVKEISAISSKVVKQVLIPEIEKEVNTGKNFANLRQIYNSMILATWYKETLKESLLSQIYFDQSKTKGIDIPNEEEVKKKIYEQYTAAFKRGVYDYIKEDYDPTSKSFIPRRYISGGFDLKDVEVERRQMERVRQNPRRFLSPVAITHVNDLERLASQGIETPEGTRGLRRVSSLAVENTAATVPQTPPRLRLVEDRPARDGRPAVADAAIEGAVERLDPVPKTISEIRTEHANGYEYHTGAVESEWYDENFRFDLLNLVNDLKGDGTEVIADISVGTGGATKYLLDEIKRQGKSIRKLIATDVDFKLAQDYTEMAKYVLAQENYSGVVTEGIEFHRAKRIGTLGQGKHLYGTLDQVEGLGEVDHVIMENAIHLLNSGQRVALFKGVKKALKKDGTLIIGTGGLEDKANRPEDAIVIDDLFHRMRPVAQELIDTDDSYKFIREKAQQLRNHERLTRGVNLMFPPPPTVQEVMADLETAGFGNVDAQFQLTNVERADYSGFVTDVPLLTKVGVLPEVGDNIFLGKDDDEKPILEQNGNYALHHQIIKEAYERLYNNAPLQDPMGDRSKDAFRMFWTKITAVNDAAMLSEEIIPAIRRDLQNTEIRWEDTDFIQVWFDGDFNEQNMISIKSRDRDYPKSIDDLEAMIDAVTSKTRLKVRTVWLNLTEDAKSRLKKVRHGYSSGDEAIVGKMVAGLLDRLSLRNKASMRTLDGLHGKLKLPKSDRAYNRAYSRNLYQEHLNSKDPTKSVTPPIINDNFKPSAFLSEQERQKDLGVVDYATQIVGQARYKQAATRVQVRQNPLNGGLGSSVKRTRYLQETTGRSDLGAKSTDLFFDITVSGFTADGGEVEVAEQVSVAELKYINAIKSVGEYGETVIEELVNNDSIGPMGDFLDNTIYLFDRVDQRSSAKKRTYRQVLEETSGIRLAAEMIQQHNFPVIDAETGELTIDHTAPGGHGQLGSMALQNALTAKLPENQTLIRTIYNGDGVNNSPDSEIIGWMASENIPIAMITTTKTALDKKGGLIGLEELPNGKKRTQMLELAQAKENGQEELFQATGLTEGERGKQFFNTNIAVVNYSVLQPFLIDLKKIIGEKKFNEIITPDLIVNEKTKDDGRRVIQLEGAMGSALLNFNAYVTTTNNQKVRDLLDRYKRSNPNFERLVHIVNVDETNRSKFFTPTKFAYDHVLFSETDHFRVDAQNGTLVNTAAPHLPGFGEMDSYYKDVYNAKRALKGARVKELTELNAHGKIHIPGARLSGKVTLFNDTDDIIDLNDFKDQLPTGDDSNLDLKDIVISIDRERNIHIADETTDTSIQPWRAKGSGQSLEEVLDETIKEYDIRGFDGGDNENFPQQFDEELLTWMGRGLGSARFTSDVHGETVGLKPGDTFIIGGDNGPRTEWVKENLVGGLTDAGINVLDLGTTSSGHTYSSISRLGAQGGLYVTRSHVEIGTNGVKPVVGGITLYGDMLQGIKKHILDGQYRQARAKGEVLKERTPMHDQADAQYLGSLVNEFGEDRGDGGLKKRLEEFPMDIAINFAGGAATRYVDTFKKILGDRLVHAIRAESDPWNKQGGLADVTREDDSGLSHPKADVMEHSRQNPDQFVINFDLDADRVSIVQNGRLYLGDEMSYSTIEHKLTLDPTNRDEDGTLINKAFYFDSRMKPEFKQVVKHFGGEARIHPKGHSKVKATMDVMLRDLAKERGQTVAEFLQDRPGFTIAQAEFSAHMFESNEKGENFDDALRYALKWVDTFTRIKEKHKQPRWSYEDYINHLRKEGIITESVSLKEQRTGLSNEVKKPVMNLMVEKTRQYFAGRKDFEYVTSWRKFKEKKTDYTLVNIDGVYHFMTPQGDIYWGWSNTSPKVAFGIHSDTENNRRTLTESAVAMLVDSRGEIESKTGQPLPQIGEEETIQLQALFNGQSAAQIEAQAVGKFPDTNAALAVIDQAIEASDAPTYEKALEEYIAFAERVAADRRSTVSNNQRKNARDDARRARSALRFFKSSDRVPQKFRPLATLSRVYDGSEWEKHTRALSQAINVVVSPQDFNLLTVKINEKINLPVVGQVEALIKGKSRREVEAIKSQISAIFSPIAETGQFNSGDVILIEDLTLDETPRVSEVFLNDRNDKDSPRQWVLNLHYLVERKTGNLNSHRVSATSTGRTVPFGETEIKDESGAIIAKRHRTRYLHEYIDSSHIRDVIKDDTIVYFGRKNNVPVPVLGLDERLMESYGRATGPYEDQAKRQAESNRKVVDVLNNIKRVIDSRDSLNVRGGNTVIQLVKESSPLGNQVIHVKSRNGVKRILIPESVIYDGAKLYDSQPIVFVNDQAIQAGLGETVRNRQVDLFRQLDLAARTVEKKGMELAIKANEANDRTTADILMFNSKDANELISPAQAAIESAGDDTNRIQEAYADFRLSLMNKLDQVGSGIDKVRRLGVASIEALDLEVAKNALTRVLENPEGSDALYFIEEGNSTEFELVGNLAIDVTARQNKAEVGVPTILETVQLRVREDNNRFFIGKGAVQREIPDNGSIEVPVGVQNFTISRDGRKFTLTNSTSVLMAATDQALEVPVTARYTHTLDDNQTEVTVPFHRGVLIQSELEGAEQSWIRVGKLGTYTWNTQAGEIVNFEDGVPQHFVFRGTNIPEPTNDPGQSHLTIETNGDNVKVTKRVNKWSVRVSDQAIEGGRRTPRRQDVPIAAATPFEQDLRNGGIDLNPELLDLQIKRDGDGIPLPIPQQPIQNMKIEGFVPIIINITPINSLPFNLGSSEEESSDQLSMNLN